jgi:hypothetical protein
MAATSVQPVVYLAPTSPIMLSVVSEQQILSLGTGIAGPVLSVNGRVGAVLVLGPIVTTLTYAAVMTPDLIAAGHFRVTLTGNGEIANPADALIDGQRWMLEVIQDGTGGRTLTWGSAFDFGATIGVPVLSTSPGKRDFLGFVYNLSTGLHYCVGFVAGY